MSHKSAQIALLMNIYLGTQWRQWRQQADSLLDHMWSNCPERMVRTINDSRGSSDHNVIGLEVALKDIKSGGNNVVKRTWKNFREKECVKEF